MTDLNIMELFGPGEGFEIAQAFRQMEISEEEIESAQARHPWKSGLIWNAFTLLQGTYPLSGKSDDLYRAHCRELLERVAEGVDTSHPTKAEILSFLVDLTLKAPAGEITQYWHGVLFMDLFPDYPDGDLVQQIKNNIMVSAHRTNPEERDAYYSRIQRELSAER